MAEAIPSDAFVTVAEAARALGVDARQVRRWADHLEPKDKGQDTQRTHKGQPIVTVRLSSVEALQKGDSRGETSKDTAKGQSKDTAPRPVLVSLDMSFEIAAKLADAEKRAAVAEARAELLERERNDWKEQASSLTEALRAAQDEARAARLMPSRAAMQIEAAGLTAGDSGEGSVSGGGITAPDAVRAPWWAFWRSYGASGKGRG